jgi:DNA-binding PucR family transcriptional regulator
MAPPDVLVLDREDDAVAVIPDPTGPGRARRLMQRISGPVYVGSVGPAVQAPASFAHAVALRELGRAGIVAADRVVLAADHLPELLRAADPVIAERLHDSVLAPLEGFSQARRSVLLDTLAVWLDCQGDRSRVAEELVVHPQTVSYRLNQLRDRFGDNLDDPRMRLMMQLGLLGRHT